MILTWSKILEEIKKKNIIIDPFSPKQINPNSYNYRLWIQIKKFIWIDKFWKTIFEAIAMDEDWYILEPHQMYLWSTYEIIWSQKYMINLIWRSSMGRLWLFVQLSANVWHTWTCHKRTLEIVSTLPIRIYPLMKIGQVSFWENEWNINIYQWAYSNFNNPQESLFFEKYWNDINLKSN